MDSLTDVDVDFSVSVESSVSSSVSQKKRFYKEASFSLIILSFILLSKGTSLLILGCALAVAS